MMWKLQIFEFHCGTAMDSKHIFTEYSQQPLHVNSLFQSFSYLQSSTETVLVISIKLQIFTHTKFTSNLPSADFSTDSVCCEKCITLRLYIHLETWQFWKKVMVM